MAYLEVVLAAAKAHLERLEAQRKLFAQVGCAPALI